MNTDLRAPLAPGTRRAYALAGNATITVLNPSTGKRFTYKLQQGKAFPSEIRFIRVLRGLDNTADYMYLGMITEQGKFTLTGKSRAGKDADSVRAIAWLAEHWEDPRVEVWHEGSCGRCGRALTVPSSIATGLGPTCAGKE